MQKTRKSRDFDPSLDTIQQVLGVRWRPYTPNQAELDRLWEVIDRTAREKGMILDADGRVIERRAPRPNRRVRRWDRFGRAVGASMVATFYAAFLVSAGAALFLAGYRFLAWLGVAS